VPARMPNVVIMLAFLTIIAGVLVITTNNPVISVYNLIVLYLLVAFYLIFLGISFLGISYIVIYIGAIAILFLFVIMMIDVEIINKRENQYFPLLLLLFSSFIFIFKNLTSHLGTIKFLTNPDEVYDVFHYDALSLYYELENSQNYLERMNVFFEPLVNCVNMYKLTDENLKFYYNDNYLFFVPDWSSSVNNITQISAIGDLLYTVYHSFIFIISFILLLAMVSAIILTRDKDQNNKGKYLAFFVLPHYFYQYDLFFFIIATIIIAVLLFLMNKFFSLSVKYLEKGGGFECGFTSFLQTRERFNIIFYRISLLFLVFDLEIILIFPYTAIYQNDQFISKFNVLAFLYILIIGFIYEIRENALDLSNNVSVGPVKRAQ
jgi:NADH-ubiquinone oxidoreductase chain 6